MPHNILNEIYQIDSLPANSLFDLATDYGALLAEYEEELDKYKKLENKNPPLPKYLKSKGIVDHR